MIAKAPIEIKNHGGEKIAHCCGWCYPAGSHIAAMPEAAGLKVSHGICKGHLAQMMNELAATEQTRLAPAA
jgi:hypothetical protein